VRYALMIFCVLMLGCGTSKTATTDGYQVKELTKETPTQDGGRIIEKTVTHQGESTAITKTEVDDSTRAAIGSVAPLIGGVFGAATGTPGMPWGEILGGAATLAVTGWAALKHGQTGELKRQVDFHKADADDAYAKLNSKE
jgi:hypothetical protein